MSLPLASADACARAVLARLDDGGPRDLALRETLTELRGRLDDVVAGGRRFLRLLQTALASLAAIAAASAAHEFIAGFWPRVAVIAGAIASPVMVHRALSRIPRPPIPSTAEPDGTLPELLDRLVEVTRGNGRELEACAARAWSLGHGGPVATSGEPPFVPRQSESARFEAHQVAQTLRHARELLHHQPSADADARHLLARYDHVHRRLFAAYALLHGGISANRDQSRLRGIGLIAWPLWLLAITSLPGPWWHPVVLAGMVFGFSIVTGGVFSIGLARRPTWDDPQLLAAVEGHLAEVTRLSGDTAARAVAELTAARDLLRHNA